MLNILKIKPLTPTFRKQMGHWSLKQSENSLNYIGNLEYGYIASVTLHLSHRGKNNYVKINDVVTS